MYRLSVLVFLSLCCFISTIPLNRPQLVGTQGPRSMNTTQTVAGAGGNRSGDRVDYDLGLSDQAKDSISAGRGNRLFQFPFKANALTEAKDMESPEEKPIPVINENRKPRAIDGEGHEEGQEEGEEGEAGGAGGGEGGGEVGEEEEGEEDEEEDVEGDGLDYDEEEAEEEGVEHDKVSKDTSPKPKTKPKPQPKPKSKSALDDEEESDDVDVDDLFENLATQTDNIDPSIGFKDLLMPKIPVGRQDDKAVGITYGVSRTSTRREEWRSALARAGIMSNPLDDYHPSNLKDLSQVCAKKSSIMNVPKVTNWIHKVLTNITYTKRPIYIELRKELYEFGKSEICHNTTMSEWKDYQYCALIRNQRMEYMIPKYPLHQIGYRLLYKVHRGPYDLDVMSGK